jgi:solute carrier family 25 uncoupling protein 27
MASEGSSSSPTLSTKAAIGAVSGGLSQALATPADLIKIKLLSDSRSPSPKFKGLWHCVEATVRENGLRGLYQGAGPSILRACLVNLGELASYDQGKQYMRSITGLREGWILQSLSSVLSGLVATTLSCPADVVKSRTMAQGSGFIACIADTAKQEGIGGFYIGFYPTWLRLGPWQLIFLLSYEEGRRAMRLESF